MIAARFPAEGWPINNQFLTASLVGRMACLLSLLVDTRLSFFDIGGQLRPL